MSGFPGLGAMSGLPGFGAISGLPGFGAMSGLPGLGSRSGFPGPGFGSLAAIHTAGLSVWIASIQGSTLVDVTYRMACSNTGLCKTSYPGTVLKASVLHNCLMYWLKMVLILDNRLGSGTKSWCQRSLCRSPVLNPVPRSDVT